MTTKICLCLAAITCSPVVRNPQGGTVIALGSEPSEPRPICCSSKHGRGQMKLRDRKPPFLTRPNRTKVVSDIVQMPDITETSLGSVLTVKRPTRTATRQGFDATFLKQKSLPREEVRQAFQKNRTTTGGRCAAVPTDVSLGRGVGRLNSKLCGRRRIALMRSSYAFNMKQTLTHHCHANCEWPNCSPGISRSALRGRLKEEPPAPLAGVLSFRVGKKRCRAHSKNG